MFKEEKKEIAKAEPAGVPSTLDEMERWFDEAFRRPMSLFGAPWFQRPGLTVRGELSPSVDIFRDGHDVVLKAELPGIRKEDIDISLTENSITLSGECKKEEKVERKDFYHMERSQGSFTRRFRLPEDVQPDKAKAKFRDGILEVRIPMTEAAKTKEKKLAIE